MLVFPHRYDFTDDRLKSVPERFLKDQGEVLKPRLPSSYMIGNMVQKGFLNQSEASSGLQQTW